MDILTTKCVIVEELKTTIAACLLSLCSLKFEHITMKNIRYAICN